MPKVFELDDVVRLMGGCKMGKLAVSLKGLPEGYQRYYIVRAPMYSYFFGMLENLDCHLIKTTREFNGW